MCTVGLLVSYLCILEVLVSTFAHLLYRKFTCAYLLHLWNDQSEQHQCSCSQKWFDYLGMYSLKKIHVEMSKNDDALLMHFWNYIIWMHFWFSFIGFWCSFKSASKVHHVFEHFSKILKKNQQNSEKHDSKVHQKCIKSTSLFSFKIKKNLRQWPTPLDWFFFAIQCGDR